jgi:lipopolysaccharide export LptBFGC system permease protein LptF
MDDLFRDIGPVLFGVLACTWAWFVVKSASSRKYVILLGICWLVAGIAYNIGKFFDATTLRGALGGIIVLALLSSLYFLIKFILSERKAKKKPPDD